ncbi:MaoC family dehydratase [Arthrobacter sp. BL-252-APC-1A]|uniref:FAS1-like dehydratase domain-containing protein n=1 Tax=Arthrobacter sp. BL-252-APC-1A TaxID=2606622 RepID=UPI0012B332EB|nr:MaoC family dehydratase N-terminal domain-containing protein [Arthrobacter sp. BL-252-APC-1A]MSR97803.1 MaoC family dehydratase [Arthrobacter sp. BL-252-APC-1A]
MSIDPATSIGEIITDARERVSVARDEVNRPMIHHLCDAVGERNPAYLDPEAARAAGHPGVVAPPSALQVWNMINPSDPVIESDVDRAYAELAEAGYPKVVAVNCDQEYDRYLVPGDILTAAEKVESLVGPKQTGLGEGYFITTLTTYTDQKGERVGTMRFRTLWYNPAKRSSND